MRLLWRRAVVVVGTVSLALLVSWVLQGETSPLRQYFLWHTALPNLWTTITLPAFFVSLAISGNVHAGSLGGYVLGMALQWGLIGGVLSLVLVRRAPPEPMGRTAQGRRPTMRGS